MLQWPQTSQTLTRRHGEAPIEIVAVCRLSTCAYLVARSFITLLPRAPTLIPLASKFSRRLRWRHDIYCSFCVCCIYPLDASRDNSQLHIENRFELACERAKRTISFLERSMTPYSFSFQPRSNILHKWLEEEEEEEEGDERQWCCKDNSAFFIRTFVYILPFPPPSRYTT